MRLTGRARPRGTHHLVVSATGPSDVEMLVEVTAPSVPPPDETCADAPVLLPNERLAFTLAGCDSGNQSGGGAPDQMLEAHTFLP